MSSKNAKSFKVPKIRREERKDNLRQVELTSRDCIEIVNTVKRSYLASGFETAWQLKTAALVENRELEAQYRAKKAELKEEGRHARDLMEHFAFIVQKDNTIVPFVVKDGLKCKSVYQSLLGDSKLGVYLWRNADIQLRLAEGWKVPTCTLIVFKIVLGKCKALAQQLTEENIEPTPNFDSHVPQSQPRPSDNFNIQLARSQVYLYEYTEDCEPSPRPRQCLPYAVLTYEKTDNIPLSLTTKVDSYSKRPKPASRVPEVETTKPNVVQGVTNKRDPRLGKVDSSISSGIGAEGGLCVPRLTPGPPPKDLNASVVNSVSDPDDPRSQLSFLASSSNQKFKEFSYQPSFGPSDSDEQSEFDEETNKPHEPLTSLPPLKLPLLPDPLIPPNSQLDTRYTDPRFGYVDSSATAVPSDPRSRPQDPRLQSAPLDPRFQQMQLDPRRQQGLIDPRQQQYSSDPRLKAVDPRVQQGRSQAQDLIFPVQQRISNPLSDDASKTRKKLSLSDYKKKVNISKPEIGVELSTSVNSNEKQRQQMTVSSEVKMQVFDQPPTYVQMNSASISEQRDPRLFQHTTNTGNYSQAYSANISEKRDPRLYQQRSNQTVTDSQSYSTSISEERDPRLFQQSSTETPQYNRPSSEKELVLPTSEVSGIDTEENIQDTEDDIVEETDDMAKTLNELSDPDDISQSPKQCEEPDHEEPKIDDPMLAGAMQKLVEHSGNVTLFTEALRMLQESAEEFGDQLTDPEFLVKKIAEKIEELSKLEAQKVMKSKSDVVIRGEIQEVYSPDAIMSPDLSNDSKSDNSAPVKHIPLENVDMEIEKSETKSESKLDEAMQKTLEELERIEKSKSTKLQKTRSSSKSKNKKGKKDSSFDNDLLDIPVPPEPANIPIPLEPANIPIPLEPANIPIPLEPANIPIPLEPANIPIPPEPAKQTKQEIPVATQVPPFESPVEQFDKKKPEIKRKISKENEDTEDDDMKITQILPSLKEQKEIRKKPLISFNFKRKNKPLETVLEHCKDDIDLRVKVTSSNMKKANLVKKKEIDKDSKDFGLVDEDFRKETAQSKVTHPFRSSANSDTKTEKNKTKVISVFNSDCSNLDKTKAVEKKDISKGLDIQSAGQKSSVSKFVDPFGLDSEVIDHTNSTCDSDLIQKKEVNDFGDIDWRHASGVPADVDMRSTDTSTENSQCSELGDFDLRRSHSRSVSPTPGILSSNKEISKSLPQPVRKFVDPFGLDEDTDERLITTQDTDERLISRSNSPLLSSIKSSKTAEVAPDSSQDSNSESGILFDAYSLAKSNSEGVMHASNEFGDIDWRQTAAAEMGDVDMRSVPIENPKLSGVNNHTTAVSATTASVMNTKTSVPDADPFQQMNKNLQTMFSTSHSVSQYQTSVTSSDNYSSSRPKVTYESYTVSKSTASDVYTTNRKHENTNTYNYRTSGSQLGTQSQDGFQNIMQNLDFSNLKNILANVQKPQESESEDASKTSVESDGNTTEKQEEHDLPAFVTGLASVKNKAEEPRKCESPGYKQSSSPNKKLSKEDPFLRNMDSEKHLTRIPGFDISPEKEMKQTDESTERTASKSKPKDVFDTKVNESLPLTPKDKVRLDSDDVMTPLPDISYQAAILESIEQSALKVRNDDSFTSEMEESPIRISKREKSKHRKVLSETSEYKGIGTKRRQDSSDENLSRKVLKRDSTESKNKVEEQAEDEEDDDDDDEESGLVIDLSPSVKTVNEKMNSPGILTKDPQTDTVDPTEDVEPVLVIDDAVEKERSDSDNLHAEDTLHAKSKDEMTDMIEKSRRNMVIKLKGQTKLVNPKTGKAYNEMPKGSAIEVVGQASGSKDGPSQQIHPVHGIEPVNPNKTSMASSWQNSEHAHSDQGQPIQAIAALNSGKSIQSSKPTVTTSSKEGAVSGHQVYGNASQEQAYPSVCTAHSLQISPISERLAQMSQVSTTASVINAPVSPVTLIPPINPAQQQSKSLVYIHPLTGQTIKYGQPQQVPVLPVYGNTSQLHMASVPVATVPMPEPQPVPPPVPQPVPPPSVLPPVARPVLIIPGQNPSGPLQVRTSAVPRLPFLPRRLAQLSPGVTVQTFGNQQTQQSGQQVHTLPVQQVRPQNETIPKVTQVIKGSKPSTDVFDCFRDKFEKREVKKEPGDQQKFETKPNVNADGASDSKNAYSVKLFLEDIEMKAKKELKSQLSSKTIGPIIKAEPVDRKEKKPSQIVEIDNVKGEKRAGDEDCKPVAVKKMKTEFESKPKLQNDFGSKILESLTEVKSKLRSPEKSCPSPEKPVVKPKMAEIKIEEKVIKEDPKKETSNSGASSELEDGEISDESMSDSEEPVKNVTGQYMHSISSIPVLGSRPGQFNRIPTIGSWQQTSPNRNMTVRNNTPTRHNIANKQNDSAYKVGVDWADIIQNPETRAVERIKATNIESPSLRSAASGSRDDTASIVSKSAASISKSRQKNKAQSQVKTLGEWLKLELEIDNIEPLQSIIPYALDTDLTKIPKQRKRKIRMKVKNAIEQEGTKAIGFERNETVTVEVLLSEKEMPKPLNPNYLPEVSNEQAERELQMLGTSLNLLKEKVKHQTTLSSISGNCFQNLGPLGQFGSLEGAAEDKKMIVAMTLVESEMRTHLLRTCFYGYPHRRVPDELLLNSELSGFKTEADEVFLILMMPLSAKPYHKLLQLRNSLTDLYERRNTVVNPADFVKIDEEIRQNHNQRQAVLRGFTGYLNKKRILKLQETVEKYTMVYDYFKMKTPPTPDSMLRFIRTTQMDLRQHLILARQYLA